MSVHVIYYQQGHKMMKAVETEEAYRRYRDSQTQVRNLTLIRHPQEDTDVAAAKRKLVQFNYSCLPTEDGCLKGATRLSKSVGMDIDHLSADEVKAIAATAIDKKEELGLLMLERSARGGGLHVVFRRHPEMDQEANLRWASDLLGVEYDAGAKDITRVFFATTSEDLLYLHEDLFDNGKCGAFTGQEAAFTDSETTFASQEATSTDQETSFAGQEASFAGPKTTTQPASGSPEEGEDWEEQEGKQAGKTSEGASPLNYDGVPYDRIIKKWWAFYNQGKTPSKSNRNTLTFELAVNLRHICGFDRSVLDRVIPCYDGFAEAEKLSCIDSALGERKTQMPRRLKEVVEAVRQDMIVEGREVDSIDEAMEQDDLFYYNELPQMPLGVRESINAVGPHLAMPAIFAITPAIGMLATGVRVDIHGKWSQLNLISYIAGDFASGKGSIDPIVAAWLAEVKMVDKGYLQAEEEWRARKRAAKNKKEQPEDPKYPVRWLTLNTTVANLADRLANTQGKHAFSFTPEADTVSQKWRTAMKRLLRDAATGLRRHALRPRGEVGRGRQRAHRQTAVERRDVWHARRALSCRDQLYGRLSEPTGPGTHARQHLLAALGEPLPSDGGPGDEDTAGGPSAAAHERRRQAAPAGEEGAPVVGADPAGEHQERRQDAGAPALPHLPHGHAHDDLSDALPRGRAAHQQLRNAGGGDAAQGRPHAVEEADPAPADAADARGLRRAGRLHDRQRDVLLQRAH